MFPAKWNLARIIRHAFCELLVNQKTILTNQENIMSALTDTQASLDKLKTDLTAFIAANSGGATDAQLLDIKTQVDAMDVQVAPPPAPPATA